jgi:predicted nuclease with TOPRIM domain
VDPAKGTPPTLALEREQTNNDLTEVVAQYRALGNEIDRTIRQFTEPRSGRTKSVMEEFSEAVPSAAAAMHEMKDVGANLTSLTERLNTSMGENGKIDETIASLNTSLVRLQKLTDEMSRTVANLNKELGTSLRKVNGLLDESTATMTTLHDKVDRFGNTFVGRALIARPKPDATPTR